MFYHVSSWSRILSDSHGLYILTLKAVQDSPLCNRMEISPCSNLSAHGTAMSRFFQPTGLKVPAGYSARKQQAKPSCNLWTSINFYGCLTSNVHDFHHGYPAYILYIQVAWSRILLSFCDVKICGFYISVTYFCDCDICNVMTGDVRPLRHLRSASFPRLLPLGTRTGAGFRLAFGSRGIEITQNDHPKNACNVYLYIYMCVYGVYIYIIYWLEGFESLLVCHVHCNWNSKASQLCSFGTGLAFAGLATQ